MMKSKNIRQPYIGDDGEVRELDDAFFTNAHLGAGRGRPKLPSEIRKKQVSILLDPDVIAHFKKQGRGWQTRVNAALRKVAGL